ncbi:MAG: phosphoribosylformylglycinamidine synthase [Bacteroidetes bacterium]|nr:MAG: phosphoribosylformylglycinamidine synthase [Bacteroidota bacterium]
MIYFYHKNEVYFAVQTEKKGIESDLKKLEWLFGNALFIEQEEINGKFIGPFTEMITPWSTNAVEITLNMGIKGIKRIEQYFKYQDPPETFDPMLQRKIEKLNQTLFTNKKRPKKILFIEDIQSYNEKEGLALSRDEVLYLNNLSNELGRSLTDSEVYGFAQVNSEHCRHKIFNGTFIIDNREKKKSLFTLIKQTSKKNKNTIISAYKDNVAFVDGSKIVQFSPGKQDRADYFVEKEIDSVISLKAETHNFPTTVEPFNGAATGSGGEIRDRMAGGKASMPLAGTAVYMTSYPRVSNENTWETKIKERRWLYQTPQQILTKASNGASDFGNKFGQPLICGSVFTFEHNENDKEYGFDKVIMMAGGIGYANKRDSIKDVPEKGDKIVVLGGDNYRIGMGGSSVSSVSTGEFIGKLELNAVQRSNPEMQKRVYNVVRAFAESAKNPIVSIHDHGAGGHLNCLSELIEETGGRIEIDKLPLGDPTLSNKEIIGNESQERMGLVIKEKDLPLLKAIADRERAPMYVVGEVTDDNHLTFVNKKGRKAIDLKVEDLLGKPPQSYLIDNNIETTYKDYYYSIEYFEEYLLDILQLESVACKDWLTNKVDRSVTGRVAMQQNSGSLQLPLNNLGATTLDYKGEKGIATSIGHAPVVGLIDPRKGSINSVAEALTNIMWAPLKDGIKSISLSANWMWPTKNRGEDARLYRAVDALGEFVKDLGINVPTGKDSLSMVQKYPDGQKVLSPGTVIVSAVGEISDVKKIVTPVLKNNTASSLIYIDLSFDKMKLGGSSFYQTKNTVGPDAPTVIDAKKFAKAFDVVQQQIKLGRILAGHDISSGGMMITILEMLFANPDMGLDINISNIPEDDVIKILFSENPGILIQTHHPKKLMDAFMKKGIFPYAIGRPLTQRTLKIIKHKNYEYFDIDSLRDIWFKPSALMDEKQTKKEFAVKRFENYKKQRLFFDFPMNFSGLEKDMGIGSRNNKKSGVTAAIIREKGVNGDREMAYSLYHAGFDVKDIHMTDLISGRENLKDVQMLVFVGGFSNSDVLGSAKGWAGSFIYNKKAAKALTDFYKRKDTLSLGVCNGCQLMIELGLVTKHAEQPQMKLNRSEKFESGFINVKIPENKTVMLKSLSNCRLGVWVAHAEGRFDLPMKEEDYHIPMKYAYENYPANPNCSNYNTAAISSKDGRHLAMMPHIERSIFPWQWAYYEESENKHEVSPWMQAFVDAFKWIKNK